MSNCKWRRCKTHLGISWWKGSLSKLTHETLLCSKALLSLDSDKWFREVKPFKKKIIKLLLYTGQLIIDGVDFQLPHSKVLSIIYPYWEACQVCIVRHLMNIKWSCKTKKIHGGAVKNENSSNKTHQCPTDTHCAKSLWNIGLDHDKTKQLVEWTCWRISTL